MSDELKPLDEVLPPIVEAQEPAPATHDEVKADTVNLTGAVQRVEARVVNVKEGGIGALKGEVVTVTVEEGGIGALAARRADVTINGKGGIGALAAQEVAVTNGSVSVLAAMRVTGNPKVMFDLRAGVLAGLIAGAIVATAAVIAKLALRKTAS